MKTKAIAVLALAATFFTAGYVVGDDTTRNTVATAIAADSPVAGSRSHADRGASEQWVQPALPEGHPPVLPEGHPRVLPEGHPAIPNSKASCPYGGGGDRLDRGPDGKPGLGRPVSI